MRRWPARVVLALVGVVLFAAAGLKIVGGPQAPPALVAGWASAGWWHVAAIQVELFLGAWLLIGVHRTGAWLTAVGTLTAFALVNLYGEWIGQPSCGCFGQMLAPPGVVAGLDGVLLLALAGVIRSAGVTQLGGWQIAAEGATAFAVGTGTALAGWTGFAVLTAGSTEAAIASVRGEQVFVAESVLDFGTMSAGDGGSAVAMVWNKSETPLRIIGGTSDCSCTSISDLPIDIPPGEQRAVTIYLRATGDAGSVSRASTLWTDRKGVSIVAIDVSWPDCRAVNRGSVWLERDLHFSKGVCHANVANGAAEPVRRAGGDDAGCGGRDGDAESKPGRLVLVGWLDQPDYRVGLRYRSAAAAQ